MSQITIYLDLVKRMREAAAAEGVSQSKWIARLVEERLKDTWPEFERVRGLRTVN